MARRKQYPVDVPEHQLQTPPVTSPVEAIIHHPVEFDDGYDSDDVAKKGKEIVAQEAEHARLDREHDIPRWENPRWLLTLERSDAINASLNKTESEMIKLGIEVERMKVKMYSQQDEINALKLCNEAYFHVRSRFFATCLRDRFGKSTRLDDKVIKEVNAVAHHGDPVMDARMYQKRIRKDEKIFNLLYGLSWSCVLDYENDEAVLAVLKEHASELSNVKQPLGSDAVIDDELLNSPLQAFRQAFLHFINSLEKEGYRTDFLKDPNSPESQSYWAFWKARDNFPRSYIPVRASNPHCSPA